MQWKWRWDSQSSYRFCSLRNHLPPFPGFVLQQGEGKGERKDGQKDKRQRISWEGVVLYYSIICTLAPYLRRSFRICLHSKLLLRLKFTRRLLIGRDMRVLERKIWDGWYISYERYCDGGNTATVIMGQRGTQIESCRCISEANWGGGREQEERERERERFHMRWYTKAQLQQLEIPTKEYCVCVCRPSTIFWADPLLLHSVSIWGFHSLKHGDQLWGGGWCIIIVITIVGVIAPSSLHNPHSSECNVRCKHFRYRIARGPTTQTIGMDIRASSQRQRVSENTRSSLLIPLPPLRKTISQRKVKTKLIPFPLMITDHPVPSPAIAIVSKLIHVPGSLPITVLFWESWWWRNVGDSCSPI